MSALILLLFAADPTGLEAAFESAETVDLSYHDTGFKVTLVNPETVKKLGSLVEVRGEPERLGLPLTPDLIRVTIHGKKTTGFWMTKGKIGYSDKQMISPADDKLWLALRAYFPSTEPVLIPGKLPEPPTPEELVQRTLNTAMKAADRLDVTYRRVTIKFPAGGDGIRNVHLKGLEITGEVTYNTKKPEDPVEIVFVSKETRIPIYLVGDTAYWGNDKHWRSVRLTRDSMWKQMVTTTPPPPPEPKDSAGLQAAIESADSIEATRVGGESASYKGVITLKKDDFQDWGKLGLVLGQGESRNLKDDPDGIDIVVKKGKESNKYRLITDILIFKDKSYKMEHEQLWMAICGKLQKTGR